MKETTARILAAILFLSLFVAGPAVLALAGAALGSTGGGAGTASNPWNVSEDSDAGSASTSIEFASGDCASFDAGTHPSGWRMTESVLWGTPGGPYAAFYDAGGVFLADCNVSRPGQFTAQFGRSAGTALVRTTGGSVSDLGQNFTLYMKFSLVGPAVVTDGTNRVTMYTFGPGAPNDYTACWFGTVSSGARLIAYMLRRTSGTTVTSAEVDLPLNVLHPRVMVLQRAGTTARCWIGSEDGAYHSAGIVTGVASDVTSVSQNILFGNSVGAFGAGTPYAQVDYVRVVEGNGAYFP